MWNPSHTRFAHKRMPYPKRLHINAIHPEETSKEMAWIMQVHKMNQMHMAVETQNINVIDRFPYPKWLRDTSNESTFGTWVFQVTTWQFHSMTHELTRSPVSLASDHVYRQQAWELLMPLTGFGTDRMWIQIHTRRHTHTHTHTDAHTHIHWVGIMTFCAFPRGLRQLHSLSRLPRLPSPSQLINQQ